MFRWLIHRLSTGRPQDVHSPKIPLALLPEVVSDVEQLTARMRRLETLLKDNVAAVEALDVQVSRMRAKVNGDRGGRPRLVSTVDSIPPGDKEALRKYAGIDRGRFAHED